MFGTMLKSAAAVAITGAAALTGVALASDAYMYTRKMVTGKSSSSESSRKRSKKKTAAKSKAKNRPAAKLSKNRKAA